MRDAVLVRRLRREHLVVALERHRVVGEREDGVRAPLGLVERAALGLPATAPLIREQNLGPVVVERRRVPVGEVGIGDRPDAARMRRVVHIEQQPVAAARPARQTDRRIHGDVVALVRACARPVEAEALIDDLLNAASQRLAVGGRGCAGSAACFDNAVEQRRREPWPQRPLQPKQHNHVPAVRARRIGLTLGFGDILRCLAVSRRGGQRVEDPR